MSSQILPAMIGVAGHVDHGKSSLVEILTGRTPQRHPEERSRGMTLDLSVRPLNLENGAVIGIVDVPGHSDFVKNMVAGVSSVDLTLLVVALDDGVMPQTIEHIRILALLRATRIICVLTKMDLVSDERISAVRSDIEQELQVESLSAIAVCPVSNRDGHGIEALRKIISAAVEQLPPRTNDRRAFRSYIRHTFHAPGHGWVATGIPVSGSAQRGDPIEIVTTRPKTSTIRGIQSYGREVENAQTAVSSAVAIKDVSAEDLPRGAALATPKVFIPVDTFIADISLFDLRFPSRRTELILHVGTARVSCTLRKIEASEGTADSLRATVRLLRPIVVAPGDRFILRGGSPETTLGGGMMLLPLDRQSARVLLRHGLNPQDVTDRLVRGEFLRAALVTSRPIVEFEDLVHRAQMIPSVLEEALAELEQEQVVARLGKTQWLVMDRVPVLQTKIEKLCARYHRDRKLAWGLVPSLLCDRLGIPAESFERLWPLIQNEAFDQKHGRVALKGWSPTISPKQAELKTLITLAVRKSGPLSVATGDLKTASQATTRDFEFITQLLVDEGEIFRLGNIRFVSAEVWHAGVSKLAELAAEDPHITLQRFRAATQLSRNVAVDLLEGFDRAGVTERRGDYRVVTAKESVE
jgi:selenocysteine-specific elongation factor